MANNLLNTSGLADKKVHIFEWLKTKHCAIYCLQDIRINSVCMGLFKRIGWWMHSKLLLCKQECAHTLKKLDVMVKSVYGDKECNLLVAHIVISNAYKLIPAVLYGQMPMYHSQIHKTMTGWSVIEWQNKNMR